MKETQYYPDKFVRNDLIDNILLELVKTHNEIRGLRKEVAVIDKFPPENKSYVNYVYRRKVRYASLKDKLNFLSNLLTL